MAPPKVVINKQLTGNRVNDTESNRDQFTISVNNGGTPLASFETTGSGQNVTNNSGAISLAENISYTITGASYWLKILLCVSLKGLLVAL